MRNSKWLLTLILTAFAGLGPAEARKVYMPGQDPPGPPPGSVQPSMTKDHAMELVKQITGSRIQAGTVLNGVLDDDVSSKKSKVGDVFSISLPEGLQREGQELLPKMTKIVGTVTSVLSAKIQRPGMPGNIGISLQTLVLPDGRHMQFHGFMEHNPLLNSKRSAFYNPATTVAKYGRSVTHGLTSSILGGTGIRYAKRQIGPELLLEKGEPIVLKVNRTLDLNTLQAPAAQGFVPGIAGNTPYSPQGTAPGLVGPNAMMVPGGAVPGMVPPGMVAPGMVPGMAAPGMVPGMAAPGMVPGMAQGSVPGLVPGAMRGGAVPGQASVPGMVNDPVFNQPIGAQGKIDLPDPF